MPGFKCDEVRLWVEITLDVVYSCQLLFFAPHIFPLLPSSTTSQVRVVIVDENDCVPEFLQSIYSKDGVPETVTTATSLLQGETVCPFHRTQIMVGVIVCLGLFFQLLFIITP